MCELAEDETTDDEPVNDQLVAEPETKHRKVAADVRAD
jgi:hypothetical protein